MTPDGSISVLISHMRELITQLAEDGQDERAAHVMNAILDMRKAFSVQYQAELDRLDRKRAEALRAG